MATTTNYSWTTPDDTGLVKDGASAIRSLGTAIDTTVYNNAQAAIAKAIVDAKGDIIAATAADTVARVAVGTDGQVLTADAASSAGVKWANASAGAMTELATGSVASSGTTISSISSSYKDLVLYVYNYVNSTNSGAIRLNGDTSSVYKFVGLSTGDTTVASPAASTSYPFIGAPGSGDTNISIIELPAYTLTTTPKNIFSRSSTSPVGQDRYRFGNYAPSTNAAITSITILPVSGTISAGCTYALYGVK